MCQFGLHMIHAIGFMTVKSQLLVTVHFIHGGKSAVVIVALKK